jgi:hypothetical protein
MEYTEVIANQPVVIDNVGALCTHFAAHHYSLGLRCFKGWFRWGPDPEMCLRELVRRSACLIEIIFLILKSICSWD